MASSAASDLTAASAPASDAATPAADSAQNPALNPALRAWLRERHQAVLVTLRKDGSPQSSNVAFSFDGATARVSVTADRAKTHNARRDPRVVLHVLGENFWQYVAIQGTATVSVVTETAGDAVGRELLDVYQGIAGAHDKPEEFLDAMVEQRRAVLTVTPIKATGFSPT